MKGLVGLVLLVLFCACCSGGELGQPLRMPLKGHKTQLLTRPAKFNPNYKGPARIPLTGNLTYWGEYFTTIGLGSPPQYVQLQVDTGSSDLIVYAKDCDGCGNPVHFYDSSASNTAQYIYCDSEDYTCMQDDECDGLDPCQWQDQFGDGSTITGQVINDEFTIGTVKGTSMYSIGPINTVDAPQGFEATGVDGIWGLAFSDLCGWGETPTIQILIDDLNLYNSFDMCLLEDGGIMSIGDDYSADPRFQWTPIEQEQWYTVTLNDWLMGSQSLGLSSYDLNYDGVIVDSGTTLLIVDTQILGAIQKVLVSNCTQNPLVGVCNVAAGQGLFDGKCFNLTDQQVSAFPPLTLMLQGTKGLTISPFDYLWQGTGVPKQYCLGIQAMDDLGVIIGDVFMQAFHVVFDRNKDLVGFGPLSSCPSSQSIQ
eukprot:TRINITY_DN154_c0_g1_i1.p1 TRINITY_DN154_c0_g1~~TRINITY_DN154_c0_g1_i1.p1  ORF type:complete len:441 (+),score=70.18 TRINITY_DN154_c0_g1_i1:55-1323(+)